MAETRQSVLVVEDSSAVRGFVTAALESRGAFDVTQAHSGFDALRILARARYHLIITDINMPDINGLELVRYIRESERHHKTRLLIISTDGREADRQRALELGADAYLIKPFRPEELLQAVAQLIGPSAPQSAA
jgi:two-component system chemotaxis response regulator CheY